MSATCNICGRPADDGYVNVAAHERCIDPIHDRNGVRAVPGSGPGREWIVEEKRDWGYQSRGSFASYEAAAVEVERVTRSRADLYISLALKAYSLPEGYRSGIEIRMRRVWKALSPTERVEVEKAWRS